MGAYNILIAFLISGSLLAYVVMRYKELPSDMALQFDFYGEPKYGWSKNWLSLFPLLSLIIGILFNYLPAWYPLKKHSSIFLQGFALYSILIQLFICYITILLVQWNIGKDFFIFHLLFPAIGALLIFTGLIEHISVPNQYVGIRTKWTQENEENWKRINKKGAIVMYVAGGLFIIGPSTNKWVAIGGIVILLVGLIGLLLYCYVKGKNSVKTE